MSEDHSTAIKRLVIAPHCDDETLGCGGLLAKYPDDTGVVALIAPDEQREKEFTRAKETLGYKHSEILGLRYAGTLDMRVLVKSLDQVLADWKPEELYLPYPGLHQDHIAVYEAGMRSARLSMTEGHHYAPSVFIYDVPVYGEDLYPTNLNWTVFESLTESQIDRKVNALEAYASQSVTGPHPVNSVKQMAHAIGVARQMAWAEQYALVRMSRL